jgi:hypothetical protein
VRLAVVHLAVTPMSTRQFFVVIRLHRQPVGQPVGHTPPAASRSSLAVRVRMLCARSVNLLRSTFMISPLWRGHRLARSQVGVATPAKVTLFGETGFGTERRSLL